MKLFICAMIMALATPALADDASGQWAMDGDIEGHPFKLFCTFQEDGTQLSGICHDDTPDGKRHRLTGTLTGDQVDFSYKRHYLLVELTVKYKGVITGSTITGKATAFGYSGPFTAIRQ